MNETLQYWKLMLTCIGLSFLLGCASTGSPSGGPRDKIAPQLVEEKSAKNFSTNYFPEKLELVFDEWIELKNQQREILISPPFFKTPKITSRGKKVTVEFPEEEPLREDATYTINFGKSIVDFTEGNAAEGFRFVFSTGDKIDSLGLSGRIEDAVDGKPVKDILVLLYDILEDSVVVSEKPFYYARSDDKGSFKFENLKNDTFKLLVLEDLNFNYLLDPELERLAFPDSLLILNDSTVYNPNLRLFKPEQSLRILNSSSQTPGLIHTEFNKPTKGMSYEFLYPKDFMPLVETSKDTLLFWFSEPRDTVGVIYGVDTLDFTIKPFDSIFYNKKLSIIDCNAAKTILATFDSLSISFNAPIAQVDTSLIRLTNKPKPISRVNNTQKDSLMNGRKDSLQIQKINASLDSLTADSIVVEIDSITMGNDSIVNDSIVVDSIGMNEALDTLGTMQNIEFKDGLLQDTISLNQDSLALDSIVVAVDTALQEYDFTYNSNLRKLYIDSKWREKNDYRIMLLPGAITDIYGRQNDSLTVDFKTSGLDEFGNISIDLSGLDSGQQYVVLLKLNDQMVKKTIVPDSSMKKIEYKQLRVNTYTIELIKDDDRNGEWTTGDYWLKRQPEEVKTFNLEKLRENWDLEAEVYWREPIALPKDSIGVEQDSTSLNLVPSGIKKKMPPNRKGRPEKRMEKGPDPKGKND